MTRSKQAQQVEQGLQIGVWTVTSEIPTRGPKGLTWTISCPNNHEVQVEHSRIAYGVVPMQCAQCLAAEVAARAAIKADERRLEKELSDILQEQRRKEAQQAAQIAQPDKTRAIYLSAEQAVPQQHEVQEGNTNAEVNA